MSKISEFEGAIIFKMSPELLRWFTSYSPKNDAKKLSFEEKNGIYYFDRGELEDFNRYLNSPWPKPPKGTRPTIPKGIQHEIKKEASHCCPVCRTNAGELAHIEPVSKTLNNHPHNLIYLCPNHHTVYDYGHKYNNVSKEDIYTYKKSLLAFQIAQWKLQGNTIDSYLSAINLIGRIKEVESKILKSINSEEFEILFERILNKISEIKDLNTQVSSTTGFINTIDKQEFKTYREKAYTYHNAKSKIVTSIKKESSLIDCPLCKGRGRTDYYETCPPCDGEGLLSKFQVQNTDFDIYEVENCPLCEGRGRTDYYETCPPCGGEGSLSKEQIRNIDFNIYEIGKCPLCKGRGRTDHYEICPPCGGEGRLSKEQIKNIDFDIYEIENCPLCGGRGRTDYYETCPPCGGEGILSKEQIQIIDFDIYEVENCPLCEGRGRTDNYETCPPCGGEGVLSKEQVQNIDFDIYEVENCPLCKGKGRTDHYETCPPCGGEGCLSKEQIQNIDFDIYDLEDCPLCNGRGSTDRYEICPPCGGEGLLSKDQIQNINFADY